MTTHNTLTTTAVPLNPVYMEVDQRGQDAKLVLVNADEIIDTIVSPGHPKATALLINFNYQLDTLLDGNPTMSPEEAKLYALIALIEDAFGIDHGVADDDDIFSEEAYYALAER